MGAAEKMSRAAEGLRPAHSAQEREAIG